LGNYNDEDRWIEMEVGMGNDGWEGWWYRWGN